MISCFHIITNVLLIVYVMLILDNERTADTLTAKDREKLLREIRKGRHSSLEGLRGQHLTYTLALLLLSVHLPLHCVACISGLTFKDYCFESWDSMVCLSVTLSAPLQQVTRVPWNTLVGHYFSPFILPQDTLEGHKVIPFLTITSSLVSHLTQRISVVFFLNRYLNIICFAISFSLMFKTHQRFELSLHFIYLLTGENKSVLLLKTSVKQVNYVEM